MKKVVILLTTIALLVFMGCGKADPSGTSIGKRNWDQFHKISQALGESVGELEIHQAGEERPLRVNAMYSFELYLQFHCQFESLTSQQVGTLFEAGKLGKDGRTYFHAEGYMESLRIYFKNLHTSYNLGDGSGETQNLRTQARNQIGKNGLLCSETADSQ